MHDYSKQLGKYAIIEQEGNYAIVRVKERQGDEVIHAYHDTLSLSKSVASLQRQLNDWYSREEAPIVTALDRWAKEYEKRKERSKGKTKVHGK